MDQPFPDEPIAAPSTHLDIPITRIDGSSNILGHGYDPGSRTLAVQYRSGGTYHYPDVPQEKYDGLLAAESAGSYIHTHIKPHHPPKKL